ncbi:hypothetical protein ACFFF7_01950 [Novosphingobium aquiterrae]|uniref:Uncharacterized protein n=1 Tax=Novosphingobium aquiterrae TaxID=624388 RepID=A0ABV6PEB6_9SPHN
MTIRHALASPVAPLFFSPMQQRRVVQRAANDNLGRQRHDPVLRDALKHFARHGMAAAQVARQHAEQAFFADDGQAYRHWLAICRTLDRRLAASCERATSSVARL